MDRCICLQLKAELLLISAAAADAGAGCVLPALPQKYCTRGSVNGAFLRATNEQAEQAVV
jgi:hypothetical protein